MKFGASPKPPQGIRSFTRISPIREEEAKAFSDEQWLEAIEEHNIEQARFDMDHPERRGASELAALLQGFVKKEPNRFASLALRFSADTHDSYFMNVLYGLTTDAVDEQLKLDVARRVFESNDTACLMGALDLLATIRGLHLPQDAIQFIQRMATEHPHPEPSEDPEEDLLFRGINSVRGHGVGAIRDLVSQDKAYLKSFLGTIECCVRDSSLRVRACVASAIYAVAIHDPELAIGLFKQLLDADDRLLATRDVERFLAHGLRQHSGVLRAIVERMLHSEKEMARQAGGRLACLDRLYHPNLDDLSELAMTGDPACRRGAAEVAEQNLTAPACRSWCESALQRLFNDDDTSVRKAAAHCFWHLRQQPDLPLVDYDALIRSFLNSRSFTEEPALLLHALDETRQRVPETILDVCETFVARCSEQARDVRTAIAGDEITAGKLVFRAYAQLEALPLRQRALSLIDEMCAEGLQSAGKHLTSFDR